VPRQQNMPFGRFFFMFVCRQELASAALFGLTNGVRPSPERLTEHIFTIIAGNDLYFGFWTKKHRLRK